VRVYGNEKKKEGEKWDGVASGNQRGKERKGKEGSHGERERERERERDGMGIN
jgi:hypothetical protein